MTLDKDIICSYRPISNLPFISTLVDKVVAKRINTLFDTNNLRDTFQSAYRGGHSTETALLGVKNDIGAALDRKCKIVLVMLDLSSAFETIDHEFLMTGLERSFGITDSAPAWLRGYISKRCKNRLGQRHVD